MWGPRGHRLSSLTAVSQSCSPAEALHSFQSTSRSAILRHYRLVFFFFPSVVPTPSASCHIWRRQIRVGINRVARIVSVAKSVHTGAKGPASMRAIWRRELRVGDAGGRQWSSSASARSLSSATSTPFCFPVALLTSPVIEILLTLSV